MRDLKEVVINGTSYTIGHWPVDKSLKTLVWLTKTFGEGFVSLFTSPAGLDFMGFGGEEDEEKAPKSEAEVAEKEAEEAKIIKEFVTNIVDRLDEDTYVKYARHITEGARVGSNKIDFSTHFIGKMGELHQLIFRILQLQYSDFLGGGQESDSSED